MTTIHNHLAVIGRECGDDEDSILYFQSMTVNDAMAAFKEEMRVMGGLTQEELDQAEAAGEGIFINHVLTSTAPIIQE